MLYILYNDNNAKPGENQRFDVINTDKFSEKIQQDFEQNHPGCYVTAVFHRDTELISSKTRQENEFYKNCDKYGFTPGDYMAEIRTELDETYLLVGFRTRNYRYPCLLRHAKTGSPLKATSAYVRKRLDHAKPNLNQGDATT